jgi:hypothetical protein
VQTEFTVARRDDNRRGKGSLINADHLILIGDKALWLDNATIIPTGTSYRAAAARNRRAAMNIKAREKHTTYDSHAAAQGASFFALINESGGAINPEWHSFLKTILRLTDSAAHDAIRSSYRKLMVSISCITAKGNAHSIAHSLFMNTKLRLEQSCTELRTC